jgi:hypothetical protein
MVAWNLLPPLSAAISATHSPLTTQRGARTRLGPVRQPDALPYYRTSNPALATNARHTIEAVLADG